MVNYDFVLKCYIMKFILLILFVSFAGVISLYDLGGKLVYSYNTPKMDQVHELSFLKAGLYFVKLQSNEAVQVLKWLKE